MGEWGGGGLGVHGMMGTLYTLYALYPLYALYTPYTHPPVSIMLSRMNPNPSVRNEREPHAVVVFSI